MVMPSMRSVGDATEPRKDAAKKGAAPSAALRAGSAGRTSIRFLLVISPAHPTDEDLSVGTPVAAALRPTAVRCAPFGFAQGRLFGADVCGAPFGLLPYPVERKRLLDKILIRLRLPNR